MKEVYETMEIELISIQDEDFYVCTDPDGGTYACC